MERKELSFYEETARKVRVDIVKAVTLAGSGHPGGSLSAADIITALYFGEMNIDPEDPDMEGRDKFILSKGHAVPAQYAALAERGYYPVSDMMTLRKLGSPFQGHGNMHKVPGIEMSTGSLGQGVSLACGMALGEKLRGRDSRVFLIVGDGETNEGQVWEGFSFASAKKLGNLVVLLDWNKRQLDGWTVDIHDMGDFEAKFKAFGFDTVKVNGNDVDELAAALERTRKGGDKPYAIIMDTVKGAGIKEVAETVMNHTYPVTDENLAIWKERLEAEIKELEG